MAYLHAEVKFTINCAKLILVVLTENVSVKNIMRIFGPSSGVMFELRRIISKWANAWLLLRYIGLGCFIIILSWTYLRETSSILQSRDTSDQYSASRIF